MAVSGTSYSSSHYVSLNDTNHLRLQEKSADKENLLDSQSSTQQEPAEFILRGELLEEATLNQNSQQTKQQNINPENLSAINRYEENNIPTETLAYRNQGKILDAYA